MAKPAVFAIAANAYVDMLRAVRVMPILALTFAILQAALVLIREHFGISPSDLTIPSIALSVVFVLLTAPIDIAFYRFLIMGEISRDYKLDVGSSRFRRYCLWQIAILVLLIDFIDWTIGFSAGEEDVAKAIGVLLSTFLLFACYAGLILLFPAIAADAQDATLRNALINVRGSFWRTVAILILIWIPTVALDTVLSVANDAIQLVPSPALKWLTSLTDTIFNFAGIAAAARLFNLLWPPGTRPSG